MRRVAGTVVAVAIAVVGVIGLIAFFNARDDSTTGGEGTRPAPGVPAEASGGTLLESGNVVLEFSDASFVSRLEALASDLGAPDSPELREAGQAVVLRRDAGTAGIVARAYEHTLTVTEPSDPQLQAFIERWLGQGTSG